MSAEKVNEPVSPTVKISPPKTKAPKPVDVDIPNAEEVVNTKTFGEEPTPEILESMDTLLTEMAKGLSSTPNTAPEYVKNIYGENVLIPNTNNIDMCLDD